MHTALAAAADRIVLIKEQQRPTAPAARPAVRRYRLARLRLDEPPGAGAFAHLKRTYD